MIAEPATRLLQVTQTSLAGGIYTRSSFPLVSLLAISCSLVPLVAVSLPLAPCGSSSHHVHAPAQVCSALLHRPARACTAHAAT